MPTSLFLLFFFFFTIAFSLSYAHSHSTSRRILHQPFFPLGSLPPSQPPSPSPPLPVNHPPKLPFSTTTPVNSPFFPSYPSPPPPPAPATFASFPANISSLILPQPRKPKPSSKKLLALAISAVVSALVVLGIIVFYYSRRRRSYSHADDKTYRSNTSNSNSSRRQNHPTATTTQTTVARNSSNKLRTTSTSSEFLYLGTLVNSSNIDETNSNNATANLDPRKLESPELRPLPPLNSFSLRQNNEVGSTADEEEEEFYSPRGSLGGGRESSTGTESGSRRVLFAAAINGVVDLFDARTTDSSSSSSSSSSGSVSPARSQSLSVSPPATPSPRPKSPDSASVLRVASPPPPVAFQNVRASVSASTPDESPRISLDVEQNLQSSGSTSPSKSPERPVRSPSLSPARVVSVKDETRPRPSLSSVSASPENRRSLDNSNDLDRKLESLSSLSLASGSTSTERVVEMTSVWSSPRSVTNDADRNVPSPAFSSASTSPERVLENTPSPGILIGLDRNVRSPSLSSASTSPERVLEKTPSPGISIDLDRNVKATSIFSTATTPERGLDPNPIVSPRISNVSDLAASSPECGLRKSPDASPGVMRPGMGLNERISSVLEQPVAVSSPPRAPPPPPPPPPPPMPQKVWDSPVASTPTGQSISRPPVLVPPSRPFVLQTPMKVSPIELSPTSTTAESVDDTPKPKLKPLHWDKVRASSDREMVWDQLRSSSFKLNEEMIETLFVVNTPNPKPNDTTPRFVLPSLNADNRILDPKKAQNIAILLRALNVTIEEVCEALLEGNTDTLGTELLESLLKMAPTKEEERKLKEYKDDSPTKLGHAEKFLRAVLDVPFAFKRVNAMLYIANFESEVDYLKRSFETLEAACEELRSSRMFLKLLEAVLKTGNRMNVGTNRGDAHAFKLDTLLKLVDVKGADGKTTLLHFVVQEIIRSEGARLSGTNQTPNSTSTEDAKCRKLGLQVVSGLSSELTNVKKAAAMDSEVLNSDVSKLSKGIENITEVVRLNETMGSDESSQKFSESMNNFMKMADEEIIRIQAQESVAMSLVKEITEYFHGNSAKEEAHPFRIFLVVRDFLSVLDRVCKEVGMINERTIVSSAHKFPIPVNPTLPQVFSGSSARKQYSSSDDESTSP